MRASIEVADIFRAAGPAYRTARAGHLSLNQLKVMSAIENCRTAVMGGHVDACTDCGHWGVAYNSCRNRHVHKAPDGSYAPQIRIFSLPSHPPRTCVRSYGRHRGRNDGHWDEADGDRLIANVSLPHERSLERVLSGPIRLFSTKVGAYLTEAPGEPAEIAAAVIVPIGSEIIRSANLRFDGVSVASI